MLSLPSCKVLAFSFLSLLDLGLTAQLLSSGDGSVYESNPVASWFLAHYGWSGLAAFKMGLVALVLFLSTTISIYRPRAGRRVLSFACVAVLPVVVYSSALAGCLQWCPEHAQKVVQQLLERRTSLISEIHETAAYADLVRSLSDELAAGRCGLPTAVERLQSMARAQDPRWLAILHDRYPGKSDAACLAASLVTATLHGQEGDSAARSRASFLAAELESTHGVVVFRQKQPAATGQSLAARPSFDRNGH
jgi:hypothetical protein